MPHSRLVRGNVTTTTEPRVESVHEIVEHRRRRALPRQLVARSSATTPRTRRLLLGRPRAHIEPRLVGVHDFGDGRQAVEFEGPSLDLMLYHDRGVTIAEWVTVDGELVSTIAVGDC